MNSLFHLAAPEWSHSQDALRLRALSACGIFATRPESDFDDIVKLAALACQCTSAMIAFADDQHLHFKSTVGATKLLLQRVASTFFIPTAQHSHYFWSNETPTALPLTTEFEYGNAVNFYAGVPPRAGDNQVIGVLCISDPEPRKLSPFQEEALFALGRQTEHQLTLRRMIINQSSLIKQSEVDMQTRLQSEAQLKAALARVSLVNEIGKTTRSGADSAIILTETVAKLGVALGADRCYFIAYSPDDALATVGPEWHASGFEPISGSNEMLDFEHNHDYLFLAGNSSVNGDASAGTQSNCASSVVELGLKSFLRAPVVRGNGVTALGVAMATPRTWTEDEIMLVEAVAAQARAAVETARHVLRERALLRDVLSSVTEGKLILADRPSSFPGLLSTKYEPVDLLAESGLAELRELIRTVGRTAEHAEMRTYDTLTAASEAAMNAIVHAGMGLATVSVNSNGMLQVRIEDRGTGISFDDLPKATLSRGYSTKSTLGHGLKMILETIDRLYLLTGPTGTIVVLEQERVATEPIWMSRQHMVL